MWNSIRQTAIRERSWHGELRADSLCACKRGTAFRHSPLFELAAKMPHAISLGVGEPDFETPWQIRRAGIQSLEKGQTFYTSNWGLAELRNQIAALVRRKYRLCYDADKEILVTVGAPRRSTTPSVRLSTWVTRCSFRSRVLYAISR